ncbi:MAG: DNA polymerase III subunit delta [Legionellaceae bacterium]
MLIKHTALENHLKKSQLGLYILIGSELYLMNHAVKLIKKAWRPEEDVEIKRIEITQTSDWDHLIQEANSYDLFSDHVLIDASYDKKTIDATAKAALTAYTKDINPKCLIILRAPQLTSKLLQWILTNTHTLIVQLTPLDNHSFKAWIDQQLKTNHLNTTPAVLDLMQEKTQGNMVAAAQLIEKLALSLEPHVTLTPDLLEPHLMDKSEHQLYELTEAWLQGRSSHAIYLLSMARSKQTEPVLILWLMTQVIRQLIHINSAREQGQSLHEALLLVQWPQQRKHYEGAVHRFNLKGLYAMLKKAHAIDEGIKTGSNPRVWQALESLLLT